MIGTILSSTASVEICVVSIVIGIDRLCFRTRQQSALSESEEERKPC
jgi:hypothetical protein